MGKVVLRTGIPAGIKRLFYDDDWKPFTKWEAVGNMLAGFFLASMTTFEFVLILLALPLIALAFLIGGIWYLVGKSFKLI